MNPPRLTLRRSLAVLVVLLLAAANGAATRAEQKGFSDPAPPAVNGVPAAAPPEAAAFAELTYHAAPRPLPAGAVTEDWPCFLGPRHNGTSAETKLLHHFPKGGPAVVWEVKKGTGYASPLLIDGRVVLFHRVGDQECIDCLAADTGKRFWRFAYPTAYQDRYGYCDGPRGTPVTDGQCVYAYGAEGKLHCVKLATGQLLWQRDVAAEFKLEQNFFGVGSSPIVDGDLLIINVGAPGGPCVAAFDKKTGKLAWGAGDQWGPSYATPVPAVVHGHRRVFVFAGGESRPPTGGLLCIDPAGGKVDFTFKWRGRVAESVNASSPLIVGNQVFISECYRSGGALLDIAVDGAGNLSAKPAWTAETFGTHFMTAVYQEGYLYGVDGHGPLDAPLVCVDAKTGQEMWRTEPEWQETLKTPDGDRKRRMGVARCQLMPADGGILCQGEWGHLLWVELTPKGYKELDRTWLFAAGETWTPPVVSHGLLYASQNSHDSLSGKNARLVCYDLRGE